jgi:peptide deformylase
MALKTIVQYPHESLRKIAQKVEKDTFSSIEFQQMLDNLMETLEHEHPYAAGLSGNQIDQLYRVFAVNMEIDEDVYLKQIYINPEITYISPETNIDWEGCLSFNGPKGTPDQWGLVERSSRIKLTYQTREGNLMEVTANDFYARLIQHEVDHLNGVLFIDKLQSELIDTHELEKRLRHEAEHYSAG